MIERERASEQRASYAENIWFFLTPFPFFFFFFCCGFLRKMAFSSLLLAIDIDTRKQNKP
jgi:hypothetical protein